MASGPLVRASGVPWSPATHLSKNQSRYAPALILIHLTRLVDYTKFIPRLSETLC